MQVAVVDRAGRGIGAAVVLRFEVVGEEGAFDAVARVDLQAQAGAEVGGFVAVAVGIAQAVGAAAQPGGLHVEAVAFLAGDAQRIVDRAALVGHAADAGLGLAQAVAADADTHVGRGLAGLALLGEELDHAADGVRSVHCGSGAAEYFDAVDLRERDLLPHHAPGGLRIDAHAVDIDRGEAGFGAADRHAGAVTRPAVTDDLDARLAGQHVGYADRAARLDTVAVDDGDVGQQVGQGLGHPGGGDHGVLQFGAGRGLGEKGKSGGQRQGEHGHARSGNGFHRGHESKAGTLADFPAGVWASRTHRPDGFRAHASTSLAGIRAGGTA